MAIITADIHLHTFKAFADKNAEMNSRLKSTLDVLDQILNYAIKTNDRLIVICGDTFETKNVVEAVTNNHFSDWVQKCKENSIKLIILVGNHDISSLGDERVTLLHPLKYFENVTLVNEPKVIGSNFGTISLVPFRRNQDVCREMIRSCVDQVKKQNEGSFDPQINFLFYHGAVFGAQISNREFLDKSAALTLEDLHVDFFDQVFLGHFHKHQKLSENCRYVSAPLHHDLNDAGDVRGFYHYDETENRLKFVKTKYPSFNKVEIEKEADWEANPLDDYNYWVVNVSEDVKVPPRFYSMPNIKIHKFNKKVRQQRLDIEFKATEKLDKFKIMRTYVDHINKDRLDTETLKNLGKEFLLNA